MSLPLISRTIASIRRQRIPSKVGSLAMLLQRTPMLKLLPEARVLSTSGFTEALTWTVTAIAGLGAFDSVSGATAVVQTAPVPNNAIVPAKGGESLAFLFQMTGGGGHTPKTFQITTGTLPAGLRQTGTKNSKSDSITGIPTQVGDFPITIRAWENSDNTGRSATGSFTIRVAEPNLPAITAHPAGGSFTPGQMAKLSATASSAFTYTWNHNGAPLPTGQALLFTKTSSRKYFIPTADIGTTWKTDPAFNDSTWLPATGGIGYDTGSSPTYLPHITTNTGSNKGFVYLRIPFTLNDPLALSYLQLKTQCDDGFIAYLNGIEVASLNKPASLVWNSVASGAADEAAALLFQTTPISQHLHLLKAGQNVLAVQVLNESTSSSDLLFNCELAGGIDATNSPRLVLAGLRPQDAGNYTLTVANTKGTATSDPAAIVMPPGIAVQPAPVSITAGQTAQLSVQPSTSPAPAFQWYRGESGDTSNPVSGAILASFTTPALMETTSYWVRLTNGAGSIDSNTATVTVTGTPPSITSGPAGSTIDYGATAQLQVTAEGTAPLSYQWYEGQSGDTSHPVSGATSSSFTTPPLTASAAYWVKVTNPIQTIQSGTATITVRDAFTTWEGSRFTPEEAGNPAVAAPTADPDRDGFTNEQEFAMGSDPKAVTAQPLAAAVNGAEITLAFAAPQTSGPGYAGKARLFTLESTTTPGSGPWLPVPGYIDVTGSGQTVTASLTLNGAQRFYRLKVRLAAL